ncbi:hypothetical protein BGZ65_009995 [Modicella reniformis]|uniref:Cas12f1-like TNB domain-containing protein n=1 Tax=Modicella reniformis TaxID=1440133 RepID=A0A9P6SUR5_9FUNG|nr:hypothetical protein BGZ65_009995 [Modicella reniformis]
MPVVSSLHVIKSLGHQVVGAHEYFTSARCPRPTCDSFLETVLPRSKYCRQCQVYFDRDAVGSENIARICEAQLIRQRRPLKFKPVVAATAAATTAEGSKRKRRREQ